MISKRKISEGVTLIAKCGMRSLSWCRANRYHCTECEDCTLIHRYFRHKNKVEDGKLLRHCSRCGRYLPISHFGKRECRRGDKVYVGYRSVCNYCLSEQYYEKKRAAMAAKK